MEELKEIVRDYPMGKYVILSGNALSDGEITAIDSNGKAQRAADSASLLVRGISRNVRDGKTEIRAGIYCFKNDTTNAIARTHAGKPAYVKDHETVASTGTYKIPAGLVVDVTADGVYVDMRLPALAAARAIVAAEKAASDLTALSGTVTTLSGTVEGHTTAITALQGAE